MTKPENTEARERPSEIVDQLHAAGVDRALIMKTFECIQSERAEAIAKAARLFYSRPGDIGPLSPEDFSDQLNNMSRRIWGLVAAVEVVLDASNGPLAEGVTQLANDAATEMERLAEAFQAESWLARKQEPQS